ncbi:hypothetical protein HN682_02225, partial [Candidatus Peregrinibacteria bacterium]|nr:hypothetical protein [Candidatus Peregrinibacteria bacterium]
MPQFYDTQTVHAGEFGGENELTVCDIGCDCTTITEALATSTMSPGYTVRVLDGYDDTGETFPLTFQDQSTVLKCENGEKIASSTYVLMSSGNDIRLSSSSTLQDCILENIDISPNGNGTVDVTITGNTMTTSTATTTMTFSATTNTHRWTVTNNSGFKQILQEGDDWTFSSNTMYGEAVGLGNYIFGLGGDDGSTGMSMVSNTFYSYTNKDIIYASSVDISDLSFTSNTLSYVGVDGSTAAAINLLASSTTGVNISGNYYTIPISGNSGMIISVYGPSFSGNITHNTCNNLSENTNACFKGYVASGSPTVNITSTNNLYYSSAGTATGKGEIIAIDGGTFNYYYADNGYYNLGSNTTTVNGSPTWTSGGTHRTTDPWMKSSASFPTSMQIAPHSLYHDYNIGANAGTRSTDPILIATTTINYSSIHANSIDSSLSANLKDNDTITFAAGTYDAFSISSALSGVTIGGAGATTIINAGANESAITLTSFDSGTIQDMVLQNASSSLSNYAMSDFLFATTSVYDNEYSGLYYSLDEDPAQFDDPTVDITGKFGVGSVNMHLCLLDEDGIFTLIIPDGSDVWTDSEEGMENGDMCDEYIEDIFVLSNGEYTYDSAAVAEHAVISLDGDSDTPAITRTLSYYSNIKLINSDSNTIQNVTSTDGYYGVWFNGTSVNNIVSSSIFSSSVDYDIYSDSSTSNTLKNSTFTSASSSVSGVGNVDVYYKARGYVTGAATSTDVTVTMKSTDATIATTTLTTGGDDGYTAYSDYLLAYVMTSSSIATTNGGYNPWTFIANTAGDYVTTTVEQSLTSQNQTVTIAMSGANTAPTASSVAIAGTLRVGETLVGSYTYADTDDDTESGSTYRWLVADTEGGSYSAISGATATSTVVSSTHASKFIKFEVTPNDGTEAGTAATSSASAIASTAPAVTVSESTQAVTEGSTTDTYTVVLTTKPSENVTITISAGTGVTVSASTLTFTSANWDTAQTVTVTATDDSSVEGSHSATITQTATSDDTDYDGASVGSLTVTITDNDSESGGLPSATAAPAAPPSAAPATAQVSIPPGTSQSVSVGNVTHTVSPSAPATDGSVTVTIESDPVTLTLSKDEEQLVDTDGDGEVDLFVRLDLASTGSINFTIASIPDLEFTINQAISKTDSQEVTLSLNSPDATTMAISNNEDFLGASFVDYTATSSWTLTEGDGTKKVYVKLRTANGGTKVVTDFIELTDQGFDQEVEECALLTIGQAYKTEDSPSVYYITEANNEDGTIDPTVACTKRAFTSSKIFFTYFNSWGEVEVVGSDILDNIPKNTLGFMPQGPLYNPKYGALVKVVTDPKVYLLLGTNKHWITSETVFEALGYTWDWIEDVAAGLLDKYTSAGEITYTDHHPNYTLVKYKNDPMVYRLEPNPTDDTTQVKRLIPNELTFETLNFRWDRIVTISDTEVYTDGEDLKVVDGEV